MARPGSPAARAATGGREPDAQPRPPHVSSRAAVSRRPQPRPTPSATVEGLNQLGAGAFPGLIGFEVTSVGPGACLTSRLAVRGDLLAPNGYLHAAAVVAVADTSCGYGCRINLPDGAVGFTTVELKANFLGTALDGVVGCAARLAHGGSTTQVWDATVTDESSAKTIALFRCTQLVLYPRS
jgi:1,4-dihydroxy-2-naphthoyl-CoA hydrolase